MYMSENLIVLYLDIEEAYMEHAVEHDVDMLWKPNIVNSLVKLIIRYIRIIS